VNTRKMFTPRWITRSWSPSSDCIVSALLGWSHPSSLDTKSSHPREYPESVFEGSMTDTSNPANDHDISIVSLCFIFLGVPFKFAPTELQLPILVKMYPSSCKHTYPAWSSDRQIGNRRCLPRHSAINLVLRGIQWGSWYVVYQNFFMEFVCVKKRLLSLFYQTNVIFSTVRLPNAT
jgi:hypothetical protein